MTDHELGVRVLEYLVEISASKCSITEEDIIAEPDETARDVLAGLLTMHEELVFQRRRSEETMAQLRALTVTLEQRVAAQAQAILVLSTPVIEVLPGILILPLVGVIDTQRAQQILEQSLAAVVARQSRVFIVDVTGVPALDNEVTSHLLKLVDALRLLGAHTLVSGISPAGAMSLARNGVDTTHLNPHGSLQAALRAAMALLHRRIVSTKAIEKKSATTSKPIRKVS